MNQAVSIKGTKSGIILVLDPELPFSDLKVEIEKRFDEASGFLGSNKMGLIIRGRQLSADEEENVLEIIKQRTQLKIVCIIDEESSDERFFDCVADHVSGEASHNDANVKDSTENTEVIARDFDNSALLYSGNLRSGQDISCEQSVVIMGDVKPGASVVSYGSIFILGELRGNAFAGAGGDRNAIVMALNLNPLQVRIADAIAISPDAEKGPKLKFKKRKLLAAPEEENEPEVAYIENGHIVKTLYGPTFLRQFNKK